MEQRSNSILLFGNPQAGSFSQQLFYKIKAFFELRGIHVVPSLEVRGRIGSGIARGVSRQWDAAVVVGGDGTVNRCINELGPSTVPVGIIPAGTGNVIARELGIPVGDPRKAAQVVLAEHKRRVDLGVVNGRYFVLMAGVGFDGLVSLNLPIRKHRFGIWSYVIAAIKAYLKFRPTPLFVRTGKTVLVGETALICNARLYGGPLCFACYAKMDDGLLDMILFKKMGILHIVRYLLMGSGMLPLVKSANLRYLTVNRLEIFSHRPVPVQMDGEFYGATPIQVSALPGCQEFFVPR